MDVLLSQLAQTAAQERALLEECGDLLSAAATLEVKIMHPIYKVNLSSDCFSSGFFQKCIETE
jgi:hypothetical protein